MGDDGSRFREPRAWPARPWVDSVKGAAEADHLKKQGD